MTKLQYLGIIFLIADCFFAIHFDRFWDNDTERKQWFMYDVGTFVRIALLFIQVLIFMLMSKFNKGIKISGWLILIYLLYWSVQLIIFKHWLDTQQAYL